MSARETVLSYYEALRTGDALGPFFAPGREGEDEPVKYGISETLVGIDEIRAGLADQTKTTADWVVDSRALRVTERERHAWVSDEVFLAWSDTERGIRFEFDTRWSAPMERRPTGPEVSPGNPEATPGDSDEGPDDSDATPDDSGAGPSDAGAPSWQFVGMHVSTATEL